MLLNSRISDLPSFQPELDRPDIHRPDIHHIDTDAASRYDKDLQQRVRSFLTAQHRPALRNLNVEACEGVVTLRGDVPTFYEREISVRLARRVAGVVQLVDKIIVGKLQIDARRAAAWAD